MPNFDFDVVVGKRKKDMMIVSFNSAGLCFNKNCIDALGCPKSVCIGIDKEEKVLAVKVTDKKNDFFAFNFADSQTKMTRVVLSSSVLKNQLQKMLPERRRGGWKFVAQLEKHQKMLVVDLKNPLS